MNAASPHGALSNRLSRSTVGISMYGHRSSAWLFRGGSACVNDLFYLFSHACLYKFFLFDLNLCHKSMCELQLCLFLTLFRINFFFFVTLVVCYIRCSRIPSNVLAGMAVCVDIGGQDSRAPLIDSSGLPSVCIDVTTPPSPSLPDLVSANPGT